MSEPSADLKDQLKQDMAEVNWLELTRSAPIDSLIAVAADLDLIEVAEQIALDNSDAVANWIKSGALERPDEHRREEWNAKPPQFLCVIVKPFVLIQLRS